MRDHKKRQAFRVITFSLQPKYLSIYKISFFTLVKMDLSNNSKFSQAGVGCSKRPPARPQGLWRAERTLVREHDKGPRTPLVAFLNSPLCPMANIDKMSGNRRRGSHGWGDKMRSTTLTLTAFKITIAG